MDERARRWRTAAALAVLLAGACGEEARSRDADELPDAVAQTPEDAAPDGALPDAEHPMDAILPLADAIPRPEDAALLSPDAVARTPEDATPDGASPDAEHSTDLGPTGCTVQVERLDPETGAVLDSGACRVDPQPGGPPTCRALAECMCAFLVDSAEDIANCLWALAEPRALENFSDHCRDGATIADVLGENNDIPFAGGESVRATPSAGCADVQAEI